MSPHESIILGFLQGLTEFLPVSSSGHLVLLEHWMELQASEYLYFDILLHTATLIAVSVVFHKRLLAVLASLSPKAPIDETTQRDRQLAFAILLSTVVTAAIGYPLKHTFEAMRDNLFSVGTAFLVTGLLLSLTYFENKKRENQRLSFPPHLIRFAIIMGLAQTMAIVPGISRSGATICIALLLGMSKGFAVEYSFLMSIPIILGVSVIELIKGDGMIGWYPALLGFTTSLFSGLIFLWLLVWIVKTGKLHHFAFYVIPLGLWVLWIASSG